MLDGRSTGGARAEQHRAAVVQRRLERRPGDDQPSSAVTVRQVGAPAARRRIQGEPVEPCASTRSPSRTIAVGITTGCPSSVDEPEVAERCSESSSASSAARSVLPFSRSRVIGRFACSSAHHRRSPAAAIRDGVAAARPRRGRPTSSPAVRRWRRASAAAPVPSRASGGRPTAASVSVDVAAGDQVGERAAGEVGRRHAVADVAAGPGQAGRAVEPDRRVPVAGDAERAAPAVRDRACRAAPGTARAACARSAAKTRGVAVVSRDGSREPKWYGAPRPPKTIRPSAVRWP